MMHTTDDRPVRINSLEAPTAANDCARMLRLVEAAGVRPHVLDVLRTADAKLGKGRARRAWSRLLAADVVRVDHQARQASVVRRVDLAAWEMLAIDLVNQRPTVRRTR